VVVSYLECLWRFIGLFGTPEAFGEWESNQSPLVDTGLGGDYPPGFEAFLAARGVPDREFRQAVCYTTEVVYSSLYGAADESGSRRFVDELMELVRPLGLTFPDIRPFSKSRWADDHGWGAIPSPGELAAWRNGP